MQACVLHCWVAEDDPEHCDPPCCGAGLVHDLDLSWVPPPQDTEQVPQAAHTDHAPSTKTKYSGIFYIFCEIEWDTSIIGRVYRQIEWKRFIWSWQICYTGNRPRYSGILSEGLWLTWSSANNLFNWINMKG